jgi:putative two-component system response regulator
VLPKTMLRCPDGGTAGHFGSVLPFADIDGDIHLAWRPAADGLTPEDVHDAALEGLIAHAVVADPEGPAHARRVGRIAAELAAALGIAGPRRVLLQRAAELHDLGKLALPGAVLGYQHVLDRTRRRVVEQHPLFGAAMLATAREPWLRLARTVALCHHERQDGSGYPAGLAGSGIPLAARLVAVADVYDALRSQRSYKPPMPHREALRRLREGDDRISPAHFCPQALAALLDREAAVEAVHAGMPDPPRAEARA